VSGSGEGGLPAGAVGEDVQEPSGGWHVVGVGGADPFPAVALVIDGGQSEHGQEPGFAVGAVVGEGLAGPFAGVFIGLIAVVVVGALFITAEYRRGMIRLTFAASPRRGRVLAAKALVLGAVTFAAGLVGAAFAVWLGDRLLRTNGSAIYPTTALTEVRVIAGTAALLAVAAVFALGVGALLRHGARAVTVVITAIILPYLLTVAFPVLPAGAGDWLLRLTPAAGFAIQQAIPQYPQVGGSYTPFSGYFPLAPWAGFAVLCGYAALALALAAHLAAEEGRMRQSLTPALHAEWTKLRTLASTFWLLLATAALTVTVSAAAAAAVRCPSGHCAEDPAKISLTGIYLGQAVVAVVAVMAISGEYGTGMIRVTLAAMPRRVTVGRPWRTRRLGRRRAAAGRAAASPAGRIIPPGGRPRQGDRRRPGRGARASRPGLRSQRAIGSLSSAGRPGNHARPTRPGRDVPGSPMRLRHPSVR